MPWPYDDLAKFSNLSSKEWNDAVLRGNPDRHLPKEHQHNTHTTGRGPDSGWSQEQQYGSIANMRAIQVKIPSGFPRITAETLFSPGITANIYGMAAPSLATDRALVDTGIIKGMVSFLGERDDKGAGLRTLPFASSQWDDFTGNDQALELSLQLARRFLEAPPKQGAEHLVPSVVFHCAWGLGRTGTALAAYQMMNNIMENRDNPECQEYLTEKRMKTMRVTVHGDKEKGEPAYINVHTTPAVALAINQVRRSTNPPMVAIEHEDQIRVLEKYENRIAQAMCEARPKLKVYPGAAQPTSMLGHLVPDLPAQQPLARTPVQQQQPPAWLPAQQPLVRAPVQQQQLPAQQQQPPARLPAQQQQLPARPPAQQPQLQKAGPARPPAQQQQPLAGPPAQQPKQHWIHPEMLNRMWGQTAQSIPPLDRPPPGRPGR
jgi:hypothetical protein